MKSSCDGDETRISRFYREFWREARRSAGLTAAELALRMEVPEDLVTAVERGDSRYDVGAMRKLISILGLDIEEVVDTCVRDEEIHLILVLRLK